MQDLTVESNINKPVEVVFRFIVTKFAQTYPKVTPGTIGVKQIPAGEVKIGTQYQVLSHKAVSYTITSANKKLIRKWEPKPEAGISGEVLEVIEYEPNKKVTFSSAGPEGSGTLTYNFETTPTGTAIRLLTNLDIRVSDLFKSDDEVNLSKSAIFIKFPKTLPPLLFRLALRIGLKSQLKRYKNLIEKNADLLLV